MSVKINRPRKFKGPNREYVKVDYNGETQNVMLDDAILKDWDDILDITVAPQTYHQRTNENGDLVEEDWTRLEVIDYTTMKREMKLKAFSTKLELVTKKVEESFSIKEEDFA